MPIGLRMTALNPNSEHPGAFYEDHLVLTRKNFERTMPKDALEGMLPNHDSSIELEFKHDQHVVILKARAISSVEFQGSSVMSDERITVHRGKPQKLRLGTEEYLVSAFGWT